MLEKLRAFVNKNFAKVSSAWVEIDSFTPEYYKFKPPKKNYTSPYSRKSRNVKQGGW